MAFPIGVLLKGAGAVSKSAAQHPLSKGGALAALITGGLYIAAASGVVIPEISYTLGPIVGLLAYRCCPKKVQDKIDGIAEDCINLDAIVPEVSYSAKDFPDAPPDAMSMVTTSAGEPVRTTRGGIVNGDYK